MERKQRVVQIDGVEHHHCGRCKQYKTPDNFYLNKKSLTGRGSYCKPCMREYSATEEWVEWRKKRYYKNPERTIWIEARNRAKAASLHFNIDPEDCAIPDICPVLGIKIIQKGFGTRNDGTPTLDRMNNFLGYVKGNVKVISWKANRLKSDCNDPEVFLAIAEYVRNCNTLQSS
jgi:hypothetical protein